MCLEQAAATGISIIHCIKSRVYVSPLIPSLATGAKNSCQFSSFHGTEGRYSKILPRLISVALINYEICRIAGKIYESFSFLDVSSSNSIGVSSDQWNSRRQREFNDKYIISITTVIRSNFITRGYNCIAI